MKDFLGKPIKVGDKVITTAKNYRPLVEGVIISVSDQSVVIEYLNTWNYGTKGRVETYRVKSDQFILKGE